MNIEITPIGKISVQQDRYTIVLDHEYLEGLKNIEGFSHLEIIWWAHLTDNPETRKKILAKNIFKLAPTEVGVFSSRTPERPNPIMISTVEIKNIDTDAGIITIAFIDAENGTPVLDIKPYFPVGRVKHCKTPSYYNHWPQWYEDAAGFDWKNEISFDSL